MTERGDEVTDVLSPGDRPLEVPSIRRRYEGAELWARDGAIGFTPARGMLGRDARTGQSGMTPIRAWSAPIGDRPGEAAAVVRVTAMFMRAFVAAYAVVDQQGHVLGFVPTGQYDTSSALPKDRSGWFPPDAVGDFVMRHGLTYRPALDYGRDIAALEGDFPGAAPGGRSIAVLQQLLPFILGAFTVGVGWAVTSGPVNPLVWVLLIVVLGLAGFMLRAVSRALHRRARSQQQR